MSNSPKTLIFIAELTTKCNFEVVGGDVIIKTHPLLIHSNDYGYPFEFDITRGASHFNNVNDANTISLVFSSPSGISSNKTLSVIIRGETTYLSYSVLEDDFSEVGFWIFQIKVEYSDSAQDGVFLTSPSSFLVIKGIEIESSSA